MPNSIVAVSTPPGAGGIAVIRLSGTNAFEIADRVWHGRKLADTPSHMARYGSIVDFEGNVIDKAMATVFRGPKSFTGEDTVEFSVHGSKWIQRQVVGLLIKAGAEAAGPGEFTQRAFANGKIDLAQAEAVADLIASSSRAAHRLALKQLDGSFSRRLEELRNQIIDLASLLELELDFSEEDVEFADRSRLREITESTLALIRNLAATYDAGRAFKEGVPVVIAGAPNAGKSTLLNALLLQDKAIVSDIPGTTRDIIEDTVEIDGILFRFLDTAGLRDTSDKVEQIGIERARSAIQRASIVLWLIDPTAPIAPQLSQLANAREAIGDARLVILLTKADLETESASGLMTDGGVVAKIGGESTVGSGKSIKISATTGEGLQELKTRLTEAATSEHNPESELIITNARHHAELLAGADALRRVLEALDAGLSADLIAQDVREAIHHLGLLTGAVTTDTLLSTIFSRFCIGK